MRERGIGWQLIKKLFYSGADAFPRGDSGNASFNTISIIVWSRQVSLAGVLSLKKEGTLMFEKLSRICLVTGCFFFAYGGNAQEVVHALAGTVSSIDAAAKTLTVKTDDGSEGLFRAETDSKTSLEFSKDVRAETTPAAKFTRSGAEVIVYYFGGGYLERTCCRGTGSWCRPIHQDERNGYEVRQTPTIWSLLKMAWGLNTRSPSIPRQ